ncbi:hypothetical protein [Helicobacter rodentium]|nr:hypothetical protein [Helicobacter rodentium]
MICLIMDLQVRVGCFRNRRFTSFTMTESQASLRSKAEAIHNQA